MKKIIVYFAINLIAALLGIFFTGIFGGDLKTVFAGSLGAFCNR